MHLLNTSQLVLRSNMKIWPVKLIYDPTHLPTHPLPLPVALATFCFKAVVLLLFMRGSRKFCQRGSTFFFFFEDPNTTISGPYSACQQMVICWCANHGLTLNAGLVASIAKRPYIFVIFQGRSGPPVPPPSGSAHAVDSAPIVCGVSLFGPCFVVQYL